MRDFIEPLNGRGGTTPSAAKHALTARADALGIDWPLTNPLVLSAETVERNEDPRQAPAMDAGTVRKLEDAASNVEILIGKRAFAAGILLMTYASLRFADVQKIRSLEVNADSIHGPLLTSKTKKQHGLHWPWACPRMGITKRTDWTQPLLGLRDAYQKVGGTQMSYTFPRPDHTWKLVAECPSPYSATRLKLSLLCVGLGNLRAMHIRYNRPRIFHLLRPTKCASAGRNLAMPAPTGKCPFVIGLRQYTILVRCYFHLPCFPICSPGLEVGTPALNGILVV